MKKLYYLLFVFTILSCSTYKMNYNPPSKGNEPDFLKKNQVGLIFKTNKEVRIKIYENDSLVFDGIPYKKKKVEKGIFGFVKMGRVDFRTVIVKKTSPITVKFEDIEEPLILSPKDLKPYKMVRIQKAGKHASVNFGNDFLIRR